MYSSCPFSPLLYQLYHIPRPFENINLSTFWMILALLIWVPMLILLPSGTLLRKFQVHVHWPHCVCCSCRLFPQFVFEFKSKEEKENKFKNFNFYRGCFHPWSNYSVSVSWFAWDKFPSGSSTSELHGGTSRVPEDWILASGGRRWSPLLGGTWGTCPYWNGYPVFGNGYCEQEARCSCSISVTSNTTCIIV